MDEQAVSPPMSGAARARQLWRQARALPARARVDSLLRNSIFIMATTVLTSALGYIYWTVATHAYSKHDIGLMAALISAMTLASNISNLGIGSTLVQTLPKRESGRDWSITLNAGLTIGTLGGLLAGLVVVAVLPLLSPQFSIIGHGGIYAAVFVLGVPLWTISTLLDYMFQAERATGNMLARNLIFSAIKIPLLALPLAIPHLGAMGIFLSWVLGTAVAFAWGFVVAVPRLRRGYVLTLRGIGAQVRMMLSSLAGHHFINLGGMAPLYLLPMLVTARLSATDNAYFYTTWMLGNLFFMVSPSVAASLFAEGSHSAHDILRKARTSAALIAALLAPVMLVFVLAGRYILAIFGPGYPSHGFVLLMILMVAAIPDAVTNIYVAVLRVQRRLRLGAMLNVGMAAVCLVLAWFLLPVYGIAGAGLAWFSGQTAGSIVVLCHGVMARYRRRSAEPRIELAASARRDV